MPASLTSDETQSGATDAAPRRFSFERDTFAFPNELIWAYRFDPAAAKTTFARREPKSDYTHRCFVLTRAARQFLYHARFDATRPPADENTYRRLIRSVMSRNPRRRCAPSQAIMIPGYNYLRAFSQAQAPLLKAECGGAWRSYVLRSHWRMVFPISRTHQARTADRLADAIARNGSPIVHLVRFPSLKINHGMVLFDLTETADGRVFQAYDPNDPSKPTRLTFQRRTRTFSLPANPYWAGGCLDVIEIYQSWWL